MENVNYGRNQFYDTGPQTFCNLNLLFFISSLKNRSRAFSKTSPYEPLQDGQVSLAVKPNVIGLSVIMPSVIGLNGVMLSIIKPSVIGRYAKCHWP